jgi:putative transcriptional regulator
VHYHVYDPHISEAGNRLGYQSEKGGHVLLPPPSRVGLREVVGGPVGVRSVVARHGTILPRGADRSAGEDPTPPRRTTLSREGTSDRHPEAARRESEKPGAGAGRRLYKELCREYLTRRHPAGYAAIEMPAFESHVREYRVRAGLSQEALARQLGVSRQTVVNVERGDNEPRVLLALALAAILGAAINELFRRKEV